MERIPAIVTHTTRDALVPLPKQGRGGDVKNAPFAPMPASAHVVNSVPDSIVEANRAESEWWAERNRRPRRVSRIWLRMLAAGRFEHIEQCPDLCFLCEAYRVFGVCSSCGSDSEALGADDLSRCCGSLVIIGGVS